MHNMEAIAAKTLKQYGINQLPVDLDLLAEKLDCIIFRTVKGRNLLKKPAFWTNVRIGME